MDDKTILEIREIIEEKFNFSIPDEDAEKLLTMEAVIRYLDKYLAKS